jgi:hypothetical protein
MQSPLSVLQVLAHGPDRNCAASAAGGGSGERRGSEFICAVTTRLDEASPANWYRDAALFRIADGFFELGRLKSQGSSHDDQKEAYFWFYLGHKLFPNVPAFDGPEQQAAALLTAKEIADQQNKTAAWLHINVPERQTQTKSH